MGGGRARRFEAVATGGVTHPAVNAGCEASVGAWKEEGGRRPFFLGNRVKVGGRGGAEMHRAEGANGLDQLHQFGVAGEKPLGTEGPDRADLKVRGTPEGSRLRTGAPEDETEGRDEKGGKNQVDTSGGRGGRE